MCSILCLFGIVWREDRLVNFSCLRIFRYAVICLDFLRVWIRTGNVDDLAFQWGRRNCWFDYQGGIRFWRCRRFGDIFWWCWGWSWSWWNFLDFAFLVFLLGLQLCSSQLHFSAHQLDIFLGSVQDYNFVIGVGSLTDGADVCLQFLQCSFAEYTC